MNTRLDESSAISRHGKQWYRGLDIVVPNLILIAFVDPAKEISQAWGYSAATSSNEFRRRYEELMNAIHRIELFAGFCYTQFTDTFQEANGIFTADRIPKFPLNSIARATRGVGLGRGELPSVPQPPPIPHDNEPLDMPRNLLTGPS